jgi:hypothetical protein
VVQIGGSGDVKAAYYNQSDVNLSLRQYTQLVSQEFKIRSKNARLHFLAHASR